MSRHIVTVYKGEKSDSEGVIGYDPPLRTFFLQAFPNDETDENELWLGGFLEQFPTLESIVNGARAQGYELAGLSQENILSLIKESSIPTPPSIGELLGLVQRAAE